MKINLTKMLRELTAVVIARGRGWDAYRFALRFPGADIAALQAVVVDRGKGYDAYLFMCDIRGADVAALQAAFPAAEV